MARLRRSSTCVVMSLIFIPVVMTFPDELGPQRKECGDVCESYLKQPLINQPAQPTSVCPRTCWCFGDLGSPGLRRKPSAPNPVVYLIKDTWERPRCSFNDLSLFLHLYVISTREIKRSGLCALAKQKTTSGRRRPSSCFVAADAESQAMQSFAPQQSQALGPPSTVSRRLLPGSASWGARHLPFVLAEGDTSQHPCSLCQRPSPPRGSWSADAPAPEPPA